MSLPKEPRQKMINMMYLVLTAMLALNVSAEIINAFKTIDSSLVKSNSTLSSATSEIYDAFAASLEDPKTREKAAIWKPKADQVQALSAKLTVYIDNLKDGLKRGSGYDPEKGDTTFKIDNLDAATRIMGTEGKGEELRLALEQYKKDILSIDPEIAKEFDHNLPVNTEKPVSQAGNTNQDWSAAYFHMTPTIAALTILSKFQNDVKNTENKVASFCFKKIGDVKVIFDKFEPMIGANATYLMPGEQLEIKAGLGAFNASVMPKVFINGNAVTVGANGVADVKMPAGGSGPHKMNIDVKYPDPATGEEKTISKVFEYTVGQPSGVAVMADKMNVLYVGVDNPLTITAGAGSEKVSASISNGRVSKAGGSKYIAKPEQPGEANVNVMVDGKSVGKVAFRVKYLPPATGMVGTFEGGQVSTAQFKAMGGVRAVLQNSEFEALYEVVSYTIADLSSPDYNPIANNGPRWGGSAASLVNNLKPGRGVYIDNIKARGPDGRTITLKPLSFILR
ncbi:gliding motility protein GldM [Agriterribacter sp.]|uniref:type IX secretion system motor protein PorM/GldM n=1 Tax=Agriterribacter sp. TaxID=2821509 RepID=UPI002CA1F6FA|nr:gliding motility protein GldM [Agriterribacter sp.]HRO45624.1 gliding motility protein GldM [Agriterribacter sp.]HRQ17445.1 gliding motility protein GldM [Agriterribacter sp.]